MVMQHGTQAFAGSPVLHDRGLTCLAAEPGCSADDPALSGGSSPDVTFLGAASKACHPLLAAFGSAAAFVALPAARGHQGRPTAAASSMNLKRCLTLRSDYWQLGLLATGLGSGLPLVGKLSLREMLFPASVTSTPSPLRPLPEGTGAGFEGPGRTKADSPNPKSADSVAGFLPTSLLSGSLQTNSTLSLSVHRESLWKKMKKIRIGVMSAC